MNKKHEWCIVTSGLPENDPTFEIWHRRKKRIQRDRDRIESIFSKIKAEKILKPRE